MVENQNGEQVTPYNAPHTPYSLEGQWQPWYDDRRDYNTNAPTYYDYLAHMNKLPEAEVEVINNVAKRNIAVKNTNTIEMNKQGDWISEGDKGDNGQASWHYVVNLTANVKIDDIRRPTIRFKDKKYNCTNSIRILDYGLYVPEYLPIMNDMQEDINRVANAHSDYVTYNDSKIEQFHASINYLNGEVDTLKAENAKLRSAIQKFIDNMNYNGNATTNNIEDFQIVDGIACGNINVWGGQAGGGSLIRTHKDVRENDITVGHI